MCMQSNLVVGDKFGPIHLADVSRKLVLDMMEIERFAGRRIIHISTANVEWINTKLTYLAVKITRGSPAVPGSVSRGRLSELLGPHTGPSPSKGFLQRVPGTLPSSSGRQHGPHIMSAAVLFALRKTRKTRERERERTTQRKAERERERENEKGRERERDRQILRTIL